MPDELPGCRLLPSLIIYFDVKGVNNSEQQHISYQPGRF